MSQEETLSATLARLRAGIDAELPTAVMLRHRIRDAPDLSGQESPTAERVRRMIPDASVETVATTGVLLRLGPQDGPAILVRAELDAMPAAGRPGGIHSCGHDVHLAAVTALGRSAARSALPTGLVILLQPREETLPSGALDVVSSGRLQAHDVRAAVGVHVHPGREVGTVAVGRGPINAASDEFDVTIVGSSGHGAYPHLATDAIPVMAQFLLALQTVVSRRIDPMHAAVVTVGKLRAGDAPNAVAGSATVSGCLRAMREDDRRILRRAVTQLAEGIATAHSCTARVTVHAGEPVLTNHSGLADHVAAWLQAAGIALSDPLRSCGADDFAHYTAITPAVMVFAGTHVPGQPAESLHSEAFVPGDSSVRHVARTMATAYVAAVEALADGTLTAR